MLRTKWFDIPLENYIFLISPKHEFLHSQGQKPASLWSSIG